MNMIDLDRSKLLNYTDKHGLRITGFGGDAHQVVWHSRDGFLAEFVDKWVSLILLRFPAKNVIGHQEKIKNGVRRVCKQ
jgi:hypothetical protein